MKEKAVIDRFEGELAVLLVGDKERKLVVGKDCLPAGVKEGQWLKVTLDKDKVTGAEINEEETDKVKERIADKLERLRRGEHLR